MGGSFRNPESEHARGAPHGRMDHLLEVATEVFLERGFEATSVGEIAARANASKGTFYSRYPTKHKLFEEVIRRAADESFHEFDSIFLEAEPERALTALGERLHDLVLAPGCVDLLRIVYMESRQFPELGRFFYESGPKRVRDQLAEYLKQQVAKGALIEMRAGIAAEQFIDSVLGEMVRRVALNLTPAPTKGQRRRRVETAVTTFLRSYRK